MDDIKTQTTNQTFGCRNDMIGKTTDQCARCGKNFPLITAISMQPGASNPIELFHYYLVKVDTTPEHDATIARCCANCGKGDRGARRVVTRVHNY
jgi:hypothetical protein